VPTTLYTLSLHDALPIYTKCLICFIFFFYFLGIFLSSCIQVCILIAKFTVNLQFIYGIFNELKCLQISFIIQFRFTFSKIRNELTINKVLLSCYFTRLISIGHTQ